VPTIIILIRLVGVKKTQLTVSAKTVYNPAAHLFLPGSANSRRPAKTFRL